MKKMQRAVALLFLLLTQIPLIAQDSQENMIRNRVAAYFVGYVSQDYTNSRPAMHSRIDSVSINTELHELTLKANKTFAEQPFTRASILRIYREISALLPAPYNTYKINITVNGMPIESLCPELTMHSWEGIDYKGNAWVTPISVPYKITQGLQGRHLTMWASHGKYYKIESGMWGWQRPRLYCTSEDLFTQTFMVPFLMPMLENAGAIVFTPRERDWQKEEIIVDNDTPTQNGSFTETNGNYEWQSVEHGFAKLHDFYFDKMNPFVDGTARMVETQTSKRLASTTTWTPNIEKEGRYAVYVSYKTLPTSVCDATYTVKHKGVSTRFRINQQMGGGTWVYLGTFDFSAGCNSDNCVMLSNMSNYRGCITADAVRFGGGMGIIARGDTLSTTTTRSMLPRYLEGARYNAQWSGMPYPIYGTKESMNDYGEDINARSLMSNYIARGSVFVPFDSTHIEGLRVPLEMSLALHSDAGNTPDESIIGTLGIYTTGYNDGKLASGLSRLASRQLCEKIMTQVTSDARHYCPQWTRREMRDENYSETREPQVPSMILEMFSHQNWADMRLGHDPTFKFIFSRAIYKGILKFIGDMHGTKEQVTQPLPVKDFSAIVSVVGDSVTLSWQPSIDETDSTAMPHSYVVYESRGDMGYDNGTQIFGTSVKLPLVTGQMYRYKVVAVNEGGKSMDSEELCAYSAGATAKHQLLIINGFQRLASPLPIDNDSIRGFDIKADPGVVFQHSPCYCGKQVYWSKDGYGREGANGLGNSGNEYEGLLIAGNTFDYPTQHATDIITAFNQINISSTSRGAQEHGNVREYGWDAIDLILGAQRNDGYSMTSAPALTEKICKSLSASVRNGASLLVSGAYVGSDIRDEYTKEFFNNSLHCQYAGKIELTDSTSTCFGLNTDIVLPYKPNEQTYYAPTVDVLSPTDSDSFPFVLHKTSGYGVGIACQKQGQRAMTFGFPIECIQQQDIRRQVICSAINFLLQ